jgi:hypothetical protein
MSSRRWSATSRHPIRLYVCSKSVTAGPPCQYEIVNTHRGRPRIVFGSADGMTDARTGAVSTHHDASLLLDNAACRRASPNAGIHVRLPSKFRCSRTLRGVPRRLRQRHRSGAYRAGFSAARQHSRCHRAAAGNPQRFARAKSACHIKWVETVSLPSAKAASQPERRHIARRR